MVSELLEGNRTLSLRNLSSITGLSTHTVRQIVRKDLKLTRRIPKFMPKELTEVQKWTRWTLAKDNLQWLCSHEDPDAFVRRIVTGDETWVSTYEMLTKANSFHWISPQDKRPKKPLRIDGLKKVMMTLFFYCAGVILIAFLDPKDKIDSPRYCLTLSKLKEALRKKRPHLWKDKSFILHHDNASPHGSDFTTCKMRKWGFNLLEHPPNSPDMAPCDFSIFPKMKAKMRGIHYPNVQTLKEETRNILMAFPKSVFDDALHEMVLRWQKCEAVNGEYFEGNGVQIDPLFAKGPADDSDEDSDISQADQDSVDHSQEDCDSD